MRHRWTGLRTLILRILAVFFIIQTSASALANEKSTTEGKVEVVYNGHFTLHVTLRTGSMGESKFSKHLLPWAVSDNMIIVASFTGGRCLKRNLPVDDPLYFEISVPADSLLEGDIDLERIFPELASVSKETDIQVFWAYEAPKTLHISRWSGGWVLIPQRK